MSDLELRVPAHLSARLERGVDSSAGKRVVFGLVAAASLPDRHLLLLRELIEVPEHAYLSPGAHGARWDGGFTIQTLNRALAANLGVVIFHEHAFRGPVRLSRDDLQSGTEQLEVTVSTAEQPYDSALTNRKGMFTLHTPEKGKVPLRLSHADGRSTTAEVDLDVEQSAYQLVLG